MKTPSRGMGHRPDQYMGAERELHSEEDLLAADDLPDESMELKDCIDYYHDQENTSTCTGQGVTGAAETLSNYEVQIKQREKPLPRLSPLGLYTGGRWLEDPTSIQDIGARPRDVMTFGQLHGIVAEERWPLTPENLNAPLPVDVLKAGFDAKLDNFARIVGLNNDLITNLRRAIASHYTVPFAQIVDQTFMEFTGKEGEVMRPFSGQSRGGHVTYLAAYKKYPADPFGFAFWDANSWGTSWGYGGGAWIPATRIVQVSSDLYGIRLTPETVT